MKPNLALKCFWMDEEQFEDHLIDKLHEKKKYIEFLEQEGSIIADKFQNKQFIYNLRNNDL